MAVRATVSRFPIDPGAQEGSGLPWGVTVTPFAEKDEVGQGPEYGSEGDLLPRCENCWGYFNTYCELEQWSWNCSLCGTLNGLSSKAIARYSRPDSCPEMMSSFVDLELPGESLTHSLTPSLAHWLTVWLAINNLVFVSLFFFLFLVCRGRKWGRSNASSSCLCCSGGFVMYDHDAFRLQLFSCFWFNVWILS